MISAWRVFPWDPRAAEDEPFSVSFVPGGQGYGRFDLPSQDAGYDGLRWWSVFFGEWHTLALYADRVPIDTLRFSAPEVLELDHPAVREAADQLGISVVAAR